MKNMETIETIELEKGETRDDPPRVVRCTWSEDGRLLEKIYEKGGMIQNRTRHKILIRTGGITGTEIYVNGNKLEGVRGFCFKQNAQEEKGLPILQIDLLATDVTLETKAVPKLPYPFSEFYVLKTTSDSE